MNPIVRLVLLIALLGAIVWFALFVAGGGSGSPVAAAPRRFHSSSQCAQCHQDVWQEWHGSHHQIAYLNPEVRQLSDDFRNKECQACHLPRPVAVTGYKKRTLHRNTLPDEGVSCLTCHLGANGEILGRDSNPSAPCQPQASAEVASVALCESCHNQHKTTDQWRATKFAKEGTDCNACHMARVDRPRGKGRSHVFAASHDISVIRSALRVASRVEAGALVVEVENTNAGHNFPTEERSRASDVRVRFAVDGDWQQAHRFRLPYRSEPLPDTTLPHGETETVRVPVPDGANRAEVRVWYRLTPYVGDDDHRSALLFEQVLESRDGVWVARELATPDNPGKSAFVRPDPAPIPNVAVDLAAPEAKGPQVPPLTLEPKLPKLREIVAAAPAAPSGKRMKEMRELCQLAFAPDAHLNRLSAKARRALLESPDAFWALEEALTNEDPEVRSNAAFELGRLGSPASVLPLTLRLKYEVENGQVLTWVADALARLGSYAGMSQLAAWMQKPQTAELAGQRAIEICRNAGIEVGESPTWEELAEHIAKLHEDWRAQSAPVEIDALTRARIARHLLDLEEFQLRGVDETRFVLSRLGTAAVPLLREALHAAEPYLRTHALEILRELGAPGRAATGDIIPLLGDELTRADAARALGRVGARDTEPLLTTCLDAADLELRAAAAAALGRLGATSAVARLQALFADPSQTKDVRVQTAFSLAILDPDGGTRTWLEGALKSASYHVPTLRELLDEIDRTR